MRAAELLALVGLEDVSPMQRVEGLGMAQRQLIEIAKALSGDSRIVIMDEPTATLTPRETLRLFGVCARAGWLRPVREKSVAQRAVRQFDIRLSSIEQPPRQLSGGNQQKVVLGEWLLREPKVLILDEPTRGVDVGAKAKIHALLLRMADAGMALLVVSSDLPELIGLCDRIIVLSRGRLVGELWRGVIDTRAILDLA